MELKQARKALVSLAQEIGRKNLVWANMGNVSLRLSEEAILITPTGGFLEKMDNEDLVMVDLEGRIIGEGKPSSELPLHLEIYKKRSDISWIVHTHSPYLIALSLIGAKIDFLNPEFEGVLGGVVTVPYIKPHSLELGREVAGRLKDSNIALMERHGAVVVGADEVSVMIRAETIERIAQINFIASVWKRVSQEENGGF